ncbi:circularly permutated Ras protein 1-like isoform X2 [Mugil cephalus]|uniref:circularly permutated Ras protein 1-like isoform X2 n=1 Tax=Mugil cephalus TaxID=48193 RepID=UPI001FB64E43|nr:circularly permutated Ras protein 1-like isoform X2 [Mugil cephalus]
MVVLYEHHLSLCALKMEFACGFVYVPPSLSQRDGRKSNNNVIKRSALLPPLNRVRPRSPPPPPPTLSNSTKATTSESALFSANVSSRIEQLGKTLEAKVTKPTPFYENAEFHNKASNVSMTPQHTTTRKKALLPPHMKSAASGQPPPVNQPLTSPSSQIFTYDLPKEDPDLNAHPWDLNYSYNTPEGSGDEVKLQPDSGIVPASAPALPPRPSFMKSLPVYLVVLPFSTSTPSCSQKSSSTTPIAKSSVSEVSEDKGPLPGNPNVVLVSLGKLISEGKEQIIQGEPTFCSECGSVLDSCYYNVVNRCSFCRPWDLTSPPSIKQPPLSGDKDNLFVLNPNEKPLSTSDALLLFCIDISGSMSITSQVSETEYTIHRSRLEFVQEAVLQSVRSLSEQKPDTRVGLITFNHQVTMHGHENCTSSSLSGVELIDVDYLKDAAASFPCPPPISQTKDFLQGQVMGLCANGATALGPAALFAIAMASRQPGSKVIICTDGKANAELGNLEEEDEDSRTLLSSTIFYQELGDVTVSVLSIEGTDCRLEELGRLADRTGGKVVIASPNRLHPEFEQIIENRTIATHCSVTLLLPKTLQMRGERSSGHQATRDVGNVDPETEITFQFGANEQDTEVPAPASGSSVAIQLQIRYRKRNGQMMLRVITTNRDITDDSSAALSSLSVAIIQLNSSQASAALAVRGRFLDARTEAEQQRKLIERVLEHNCSTEDEQIYQEWIKTMEPVYNNIHNFTRRKSVISDSQSLTDAGAALLYTMKHSNRMSISLKDKQRL